MRGFVIHEDYGLRNRNKKHIDHEIGLTFCGKRLIISMLKVVVEVPVRQRLKNSITTESSVCLILVLSGTRSFVYRKDFNMKYTIVFTHNPQDFFEGIEPEDLIVVQEATNEELEAEIVPMVDGGYKAIVFQAGE